ncbi:hypothetical protein DPMN_113444 [Dreissena polymorpha]|uniref:Uncharacterized protein n=1 Tax=Dreissena polymorpha TaxID=45954 RepID=A0A9D4KIA8_DREPO|nr:hypothetical protein DPMN_113444 [Dreissena polymorpha]
MADENETETESTTPLAEMEIDRQDEESELSFHDEENNIGDEIPVLEGSFVEVDGEGEMTQSTSAYACLKCKKHINTKKSKNPLEGTF